MEQLDIAIITKRSISGVVALVSRTLFIQIISQVVALLLTIYLFPDQFGIFYLVSAVISFFTYFSDIGLAGALIQKHDEVTEDDLRTTFTLQQSLVISLSLIGFLISGFVQNLYHLDTAGIQLYQAFIIAFFLSSLKTIPSIILERNLYFQKLVIPEIVETLIFNVTVLTLAIKGFGVTSFTIAVLLRGIFGLIAMYIIAPWKIGFGFSKKSAKQLLSFGIPFQLNSVLALVKDNLLIVYLGTILPLSQVGFVGFAQKWSLQPLRLVMDNIIRITFPSFSRLAHDKNYLATAIEKTLFATTAFVFPAVTGMVLLMPYFISFIPKYQKWEPAILSLAFFAINAAISSISTPLTNALNAIGKIKISLYFMIFWTVATWVLTPLAIMWFQFNGVAIASAIISSSVLIVVYIAKKYIPVNVIDAIKYPFIGALGMGIVLFLVRSLLITNIIMLGLTVIIGVGVYFGILYLIAKQIVVSDYLYIKQNLKKHE